VSTTPISGMTGGVCEGCGLPAPTTQDRYCAACGRQLPLPEVGPRKRSATSQPSPDAAHAAAWQAQQVMQQWPVATNWPVPSHDEGSTPAALVAALAVAIIVAFIGGAVAIILAVSNGDSAGPSAAVGAVATTITVISHG
jgi:hypothetical protein